MKSTLIGYTGFVGSNLASQHVFDRQYNSKNIDEAFKEQHELVIYSGVRAEKFLANKHPEQDREIINQAKENIERLRPKKLVLISTIDVYKTPVGVSESTPIVTDGLHAYGLNRFELECWVRDNVPNHCIIRLPALFGENLKKNFIFDMIQIVPSMLKTELWKELCLRSSLIEEMYQDAGNGFYKLRDIGRGQFADLRNFFKANDFNALKFTDSRNEYQFYNLANLYADIQKAIAAEIKLLNLAVPPVQAGELYRDIFGCPFNNESANAPVLYDMRTEHSLRFGGKDGYVVDANVNKMEMKEFVTSRIRRFEMR